MVSFVGLVKNMRIKIFSTDFFLAHPFQLSNTKTCEIYFLIIASFKIQKNNTEYMGVEDWIVYLTFTFLGRMTHT